MEDFKKIGRSIWLGDKAMGNCLTSCSGGLHSHCQSWAEDTLSWLSSRINKIYKRPVSSVNRPPSNLNSAAEFICFPHADLTERDKANKSSPAWREPCFLSKASVLVRKRLVGLESRAITCVPRALPLICWVLSHTILCLFSLSQWYWRNVFVQPPLPPRACCAVI